MRKTTLFAGLLCLALVFGTLVPQADAFGHRRHRGYYYGGYSAPSYYYAPYSYGYAAPYYSGYYAAPAYGSYYAAPAYSGWNSYYPAYGGYRSFGGWVNTPFVSVGW